VCASSPRKFTIVFTPRSLSFRKPPSFRLSAAIELLIDLMKVWYSGVARLDLRETGERQHCRQHTGGECGETSSDRRHQLGYL